MTFQIIQRPDLPASHSPYRIVDETGRELAWANRFLDAQCVRGLAKLTLSAYAYLLLHFARWWSGQPGVDIHDFRAEPFHESTLVDYVRAQLDAHPKPTPEHINGRCALLRRLFRFHFQQDMPHPLYFMQRTWYRRSPLGYGRLVAVASADLKVKVPQRVIQPLTPEQVEHFWGSFGTARDLAIVAFMLLNGLRSREVLALTLEDLQFSQAQVRVPGKGSRIRWMPLPPETIRLLQCYLQTERPLTNAPQLFVSLKGRARGAAMTPAGLRSLFRHHRGATGVKRANPHRFRHTFGKEMLRGGVSLPALQRLMGHSHIHTTLRYIHLDAQDVFDEYARAVARIAQLEPPKLS
jgi:site-specific recombinase XerD